jgi:hypothetical protein
MRPSDTLAIASEYPVLERYLGQLRFVAALGDCIPDGMFWRQCADNLPNYLATNASATPEVVELARLERAMTKAFEASEPGPGASASVHPSVSLLTFESNTTGLWSSLICNEPPPRPYQLQQPQHVLIWRHKGQPRMRLLGEEEYLCMVSLVARNSATDVAALAYVPGWLESEVMLKSTRGTVADERSSLE